MAGTYDSYSSSQVYIVVSVLSVLSTKYLVISSNRHFAVLYFLYILCIFKACG